MPPLKVQCCDFSKRAINLVKENELYNEEHIHAETCDLVNEPIPFEPKTADFSQLIFVLSAISPENFVKVATKIFDQLKPGATLYLRDYGRYDLAQLRFAGKKGSKLKENFYVRNDKTRAYYFTTKQITNIFCKGIFSESSEAEDDTSVGVENKMFECLECEYHYRVVENRKVEKKMYRVWIQAKFRKPA